MIPAAEATSDERGATGAGAGFGAAPVNRKPHDPQKTLFGVLMCPHCGQVTVPAAGCAGGGGSAWER
jgi:hypothetical protein